MRALGESLAVGAPQFSQDKALIPRCLILEFVDAMALTLRQRRNRFDALDLPEPTQDMHAAFAEIHPPMERRFRSAIEAWVDTAAGIEARLTSLSRQPPAEVAA